MALILGYDSTQDFQIVGASLPPTATFTAECREQPGSPVLGTLTTANNRVLRVSSDTIRLVFPGALTLNWPVEFLADVIRTDLTEPEHMGFIARFRFIVPITRSVEGT